MPKALFLAILLALAAPAFAAPSQMNTLFARLAKADSPETAHPIEQRLNDMFRASGSASADLLMARVNTALGANDNKTAMKILTALTNVAPTYAEAWHTRAGLEAAGGNDGAALVALQKTVALNPRQFMALSELAGMLEAYGDKAGALKLYRRALALDPQLSGAARHVQALTKAVEGQAI